MPGELPQFRGYCMQNYYSDKNFAKALVKRDRDPRIDEREDDSGIIEELRYLALDVAAERFGQY